MFTGKELRAICRYNFVNGLIRDCSTLSRCSTCRLRTTVPPDSLNRLLEPQNNNTLQQYQSCLDASNEGIVALRLVRIMWVLISAIQFVAFIWSIYNFSDYGTSNFQNYKVVILPEAREGSIAPWWRDVVDLRWNGCRLSTQRQHHAHARTMNFTNNSIDYEYDAPVRINGFELTLPEELQSHASFRLY